VACCEILAAEEEANWEMTTVHVEVCGSRADADKLAIVLKSPPLNYGDVKVTQADNLQLTIPGNNPRIVVDANKFLVVGSK
jgi:hypothetical protein